LSLLLILCSFVTQTRAQNGILRDRVIHVWVDPHYGIDTATNYGAVQLNPNCNNGCSAGACTPVNVFLTGTCQPLLHAPWPFRTINGPSGALSYIGSNLGQAFGSCGNDSYTWKYAIIHLLPGIYARSNAYGPTNPPHPGNGQIPNGEVFPIELPAGVSIQGTSALNTIFDLGPINVDPLVAPNGGPAFQFGRAGTTATGVGTFISNVAIHGARPSRTSGSNATLTSKFAAIRLAPDLASSPTIANCFLYGNGIGVMVEASDDESVVHDGLQLINNTISFNNVGLWNGQTKTQGSKGVSRLILINNIFDSSWDNGLANPINWGLFAPSASHGFEGVALGDLSISGSGDYNAYETGGYNSGLSHPLINLQATGIRTGGSSPLNPGVDIALWTGRNVSGSRHGILYVRDLLTHMPLGVSFQNFDRSPHDFRLSPAVSPHVTSGSPVAPGTYLPVTDGARNPLVNRGWAGTLPVTMGNGLNLLTRPGKLTLPNDQNTWAFDCWNQDCEGQGNARIQTHEATIYPISGVGGIDIGADELGQLVVAGYRLGTTSFFDIKSGSSLLGPGVTPMNNKYLWFLGLPVNQIPVTAQFTLNPNRPYYRGVSHLAGPATNYIDSPTATTYYSPWFDNWSFGAPTGNPNYYLPSYADITPHLLPDFHPWWGKATINKAANPIWQDCIPGYNIALYSDPSENVIHAPGIYAGDPSGSPTYQFLDLTWQVAGGPAPATLIHQFGANPYSTGSGSSQQWPRLFRDGKAGQGFGASITLVQYTDWCLGRNGHSTTVDTLLPTTSGTSTLALRFSLENRDRPTWTANLSDTNVQSFMVLVEEDPN